MTGPSRAVRLTCIATLLSVFVAVTASTASTAGAANASTPAVTAGWPQQRFGPSQDAFAPHSPIGPDQVGQLRFSGAFTVGEPYVGDGPVVDGHLLIVTGYGLQADEAVFAYDTNCLGHQHDRYNQHNLHNQHNQHNQHANGSTCTPVWHAFVGKNTEPKLAAGDGMVFVVASGPTLLYQHERLWAFSENCASGDRQCTPDWFVDFHGTSPPSSTNLDVAPTIAGGRVYVTTENSTSSTTPQVYAFPTHCGTHGGSCSPIWHGAIAHTGTGSVAVTGDTVYVSDYGTLTAFSVNCGTNDATCSPLWSDVTGIGSSAAIAGGMAVVSSGRVLAFPAHCASSSCAPIWRSADTGMDVPVAIAYGKVYALSEHGYLDVYPLRCHGLCTAIASIDVHPRQLFAAGGPVVAGGVVYVSWSDDAIQHMVSAFSAFCHQSCQPLFQQGVGYYEFQGPAIAGSSIYLGGGMFNGPGKIYVYSIPSRLPAG